MANHERLERIGLSGIVRRQGWAWLASIAFASIMLMVLSLPAMAQPAPNARPTGGVVVAGSAVISQGPSETTITQASQTAVVNWRSFDVGSQQRVHFQQPNSSAITLVRVTGPDPSQITGRIDANGQVVLTNQSGVTFHKGAQVSVGGLIVSLADVANSNFMAGRLVFDRRGNPNARVLNSGSITIKGTGLAALVGPQVANPGTITAKLGHVVLAGAQTVRGNLFADGVPILDVTGAVSQAPVDGAGNPATTLVTNSGVISADGGTVELTAAAVDGIVQTLIHSGGKLDAASVGDATGTVVLTGVGGSIVVSGQLSAKGGAAGETGGDIAIVATGNVVVAETAAIIASGKAGGGVVAVGTTLARAEGGPSATSAATAANTTIAAGATIRANASADGTGGTVVLLSTGQTAMAGKISAKGGPQGGNGGSVELSGGALAVTGAINVSAPMGAPGTVLLGP